MDRTIIYSQETIRSYDYNKSSKRAMFGLAYAVQDLLGSSSTVVSGLAATPDSPADLSINLSAGRLYQLAAADTTAFGSLASDSAQIMQQGAAAAQKVTLTTQELSVGQSQWVLIQACFSQTDGIASDDPTTGVLNFFDPSNPSVGFVGPNNNNEALNTVRQGLVEINVLYGTPATTGSEVPPNPQPGFVGLYLVDLTYGQTQINSGNILTCGPSVGTNVPNTYAVAPFLAGLVNSHHNGQNGQAPQIKLASEVQGTLPLGNLPASSARAGGGLGTIYVYAGNPNGNVAGTAGVAGVSAPDLCVNPSTGATYVCTSTGTASTAVWVQIGGSGSGQIIWCGVSTGTANAVVLTPTPAIASLQPGTLFMFESATANTGATTVNISGLGAQSAKKESGGSLVAFTGGEFPGGDAVVSILWDGTEFQLLASNLSILATLGIGAGLREDSAGNLQAYEPVSYNVTSGFTVSTPLTAHKTKYVAGANITITVNASSSYWNGFSFTGIGQGGSITIALVSGTDSINGGTAGASLTIPQGVTGAVTTDGAGHWIVTLSGGSTTTNMVQIINLSGLWLTNQTCRHTCDLVNAASALGGACYQGYSLTFNFNGASVGINGMDTGAMPVSGDLHIYAAYNPGTNTWGCFGTTYGGGARCYAGSHAPSGFTATVLIGSFKTNGSGYLQNFVQRDRRIHISYGQLALDNLAATAANTYQALSIAAYVPANAKYCSGHLGSSTNNGNNPAFAIAHDANGVGVRRCTVGAATGQNGTLDSFLACARFDNCPIDSQQFYWKASDTLKRATCEITDYEF